MASPTQWTWVWASWIGDGQGSLECCSLWGCKELDMTEWLNWYNPLMLKFKKEKEKIHADFMSLRPWWPLLVSHPWSLSRLQSQGWSVWGWGSWRTCASHGAPPWSACWTPPQPSNTEIKPPADKGWSSLWDGRALNGPLGSVFPGGGVPSSSLLP